MIEHNLPNEKIRIKATSKCYYAKAIISPRLIDLPNFDYILEDRTVYLLHRDNDLQAIEDNNGRKEWYYQGKLHRMNGPAVI